MSDDEDLQVLLPPREAARRLGVAASTLRRLAPVYERVSGAELPWEGEEAGGGRLWPSEAVERLGAARALVAEGRAKSLESALRALAGGAQPPSGVLSRPDEGAALAELVSGLRAQLEAIQSDLAQVPPLRAELSEIPELRREVAALRSELRAQRQGRYSLPALRAGVGPAPAPADAEPDATADEGIKAQGSASESEEGLIVRWARRLERIVRGGRGG